MLVTVPPMITPNGLAKCPCATVLQQHWRFNRGNLS